MEATNDSLSRFGRPMLRDRSGYQGGGELFAVRREIDFQGGFLGEKGYNNSYLAFRPSGLFVRVLGDYIFRVNESLFKFRGSAVEQILFLEGEKLQEHYDELDKLVEAVRDRLFMLTECCHKGFDGLLEEVLEGMDRSELGVVDSAGGGEGGNYEVFEAIRQRNVEDGILTDVGREEGFVAFRSSPFYGRLIGEVVYTFNDALRRMEDRLPFYIAGGRRELVQRYHAELVKGMKPLRGEMEEVIEFCGRKIA